MKHTYSLGRPLPGHEARVGRVNLGTRPPARRNVFGTTLTCACGFHLRVMNAPPSRGGRTRANEVYGHHVEGILHEQEEARHGAT